MLNLLLMLFFTFTFATDQSERSSKDFEVLEIDGKIKSIGIDESRDLVILELDCKTVAKRVELLDTPTTRRLYEYAKVGDRLCKDKDSLRILIIRVMNSMHIQVRHFDVADGAVESRS